MNLCAAERREEDEERELVRTEQNFTPPLRILREISVGSVKRVVLREKGV